MSRCPGAPGPLRSPKGAPKLSAPQVMKTGHLNRTHLHLGNSSSNSTSKTNTFTRFLPKTWTFADFKKKRLLAQRLAGFLPVIGQDGKNEFHGISSQFHGARLAWLQKKTFDLALLQEGQLVDAIDYMGNWHHATVLRVIQPSFVKGDNGSAASAAAGKKGERGPTPFHIFTMEQHEILKRTEEKIRQAKRREDKRSEEEIQKGGEEKRRGEKRRARKRREENIR